MTLPELIEKHGLNAAHLAKKLGISRGHFNNKLKQNNGYKFTAQEQVLLLKALSEIQKDIRKYVLSID